jgi:hypothetical protein
MTKTSVAAWTAVAFLGGAIALPDIGRAVDTASPPAQSGGFTTQSATPPAAKKTKRKATKKQRRSDRQFLDGYQRAHALIYQRGEYEGGIAALRALGRDEHADVANLIGFASRKLGRYDDAKAWYEKALAADPDHSRTWSYYGMWHAEQGNMLKAKDHLDKVASLCGTGCRDYVELKAVMDGTATY